MLRNVTSCLARTRAEARDYRSTKSLEGVQIHCLTPKDTVGQHVLGQAGSNSFTLSKPGQSEFGDVERALREPDIRSDSGKICDAQIARQRLPVGFNGALHVISLLRHSGQLPRITHQRVATHAVTISKLNGLALAGHIAITLRPAKRVGTSIEILKTINKCARKTQKRIGPVAPQLRRFPKCGNSIG